MPFATGRALDSAPDMADTKPLEPRAVLEGDLGTTLERDAERAKPRGGDMDCRGDGGGGGGKRKEIWDAIKRAACLTDALTTRCGWANVSALRVTAGRQLRNHVGRLQRRREAR